MNADFRKTALALLAGALFVAPAGARPPAPPGDSLWYYQIGGARPLSLSPSPRITTANLAVGGKMANGFNCGKFDPLVSVENTLNQVSKGAEDMTNAMTQAANAAIAALPSLILQRADPGLYDLFQNALARAQALVDLSTKSCEQMQGEIDRNINPFHEWVTLGRANGWKASMGIGGRQINDINEAKEYASQGNERGMPWYGGMRGGRNQEPINAVSGVVSAGYNVLLGRDPAASGPGGSIGAAGKNQPMVDWWRSPNEAAQWSNRVLGDELIKMCDGCASSVKPGAGLSPIIEEEEEKVSASLTSLLNSNREPSPTDLDPLNAPGVSVTPEVIRALRQMPQPDREVLAGRMASEIATARAVEQAIYVRRMLIAGRDTPETSVAGPAINAVDRRLRVIEREIDNVLYEQRVRKEITGTSAETALRMRRNKANKSISEAAQSPKATNPVASEPLRK